MATATVWIRLDEGDHGKRRVTVVSHVDGDLMDGTPASPWDDVLDQRDQLERCVIDVLRGTATVADLTVISGRLVDHMGWRDGCSRLHDLTEGTPVHLKLTYETCALLPELAPLGPRGGLLDERHVFYRTIHQIGQRPVQHPQDRSLALLYEDQPSFRKVIDRLLGVLAGAGLSVATFDGSEVADDRTARRVIEQVFHHHDAVMFLGNTHRDHRTGESAWVLNRTYKLPLSRLGDSLGARATRPQRGEYTPWVMPRVVFANSCFSAAFERKADVEQTRGHADSSYPRLFLDLGVRDYIGTSMLVPLDGNGLDHVEQIARDFFVLWARDPESVARHLFAAKRACVSRLFASLYQVYTVGGRNLTGPVPHTSVGVVAALKAGSHLFAPDADWIPAAAPLVLDSLLWDDRYGRTFLARCRDRSYLVQVLADEYQDREGVATDLQAACDALRPLGKRDGLLIPSRAVRLSAGVGDHATIELHALVYERPHRESASDWRLLREEELPRTDRRLPYRVLEWGARLASAICALHQRDLIHGDLHHGSVVFLREDQQVRVLVKDAWLGFLRGGRSTDVRFAPPEEVAGSAGPEDLRKRDSWGLGVILYELATGRSPFDSEHPPSDGLALTVRQVVAAADLVPALDAITRECLMPAPGLRPSAELIADRLRLAIEAGGAYVQDLEGELDVAIQAGHRLLTITADDFDEVCKTVEALTGHDHLYLARPNEHGVTLQRYAVYLVREDGVSQFDPAVAGQVVISRRTGDDVWSAVAPLRVGLDVLQTKAGPQAIRIQPVVLVHRYGWWHGATGLARVLRDWQGDADSAPAFIASDDHVGLEEGLAEAFHHLRYPPLSPAVLFESIRTIAADCGGTAAVPSAPNAMALARLLHPCSLRELRNNLRLCYETHGVIDERVAEFRDEQRRLVFDRIGAATYVATQRAPGDRALGDRANGDSDTPFALPIAIEQELAPWVAAASASEQQADLRMARRLLLAGPSGSGKSTLALHLATVTHRPLVALHPLRCLHGDLGVSEQQLRIALGAISRLHRCAVLIESIDELEPAGPGDPAAEQGDPTLATRQRMAAILLRWIDDLPAGVILMATARDGTLAPAWRRRFLLQLELPLPVGTAPAAAEYRRRVVRTLLARYRLARLASNDEFVHWLAATTNPRRPGFPDRSLPHPLAHAILAGAATPRDPRARERAACFARVQLDSPAAIDAWMRDVLCSHADRDADQPELWQRLCEELPTWH